MSVQACANMGEHADTRGQPWVSPSEMLLMFFKKISFTGWELFGWPWNSRILVPAASSEV